MKESEKKAKEFYDKFHIYDWNESTGPEINHELIKEMCLKVVDEIIKEAAVCFCYNNGSIEFWQEVKQEIIKL